VMLLLVFLCESSEGMGGGETGTGESFIVAIASSVDESAYPDAPGDCTTEGGRTYPL
jgi:hypothetical protein